MDARFYERHSGASQVKEIYNGAREQAEGFSQVLNDYVTYNLAAERLVELQVQLEEQKTKVDELRQEMERERENVVNGNFSNVQRKYVIERSAYDELERALLVLKAIREPKVPSWLSGFIRDVVAENGKVVTENGRKRKKVKA